MVRDGVANIVIELRSRGFDPRRVGRDLWEARCPAHKGTEHALSISRNEFDHVELECRGTQNCQYSRIVGALGFTNDGVYAETPDWLISRLNGIPIQPALYKIARPQEHDEAGPTSADVANGLAETAQPLSPATAECSLESRPQAASEPKNPPEGGTPTDGCASVQAVVSDTQSSSDMSECSLESRLQAASEPKNPPEGSDFLG